MRTGQLPFPDERLPCAEHEDPPAPRAITAAGQTRGGDYFHKRRLSAMQARAAKRLIFAAGVLIESHHEQLVFVAFMILERGIEQNELAGNRRG